MFHFDKEQRAGRLGNLVFGGQPGERPPLLIASMFHNGDKILGSRKTGEFDRQKAGDYIKRQEELSAQTGIPAVVAMVANTAEEMKRYVDFFTGVSQQPFAIDMWVEKERVAAVDFIAREGLQDRLLYNSITPWDKDIPGQVKALQEAGVKSVVLQVFDQQDLSPEGRLKSLEQLLGVIGADTFENLLIDTSVMNLPAIAFSAIACRQIKEKYGLLAGVAASNGTFTWKQARELWGAEGFAAVNTAGHALSALLWSDFIFYGPLVTAPKIFPAVAAAVQILATLAYWETGRLPAGEGHPLHRFYAAFVHGLNAEVKS